MPQANSIPFLLANDGKFKCCPICKESKPLSDYDFYFSKQRNKYRPQNYCKACQPAEKKKRSADYFQKNKKARLQYAKNYRANPANKEKRKKLEKYFKKKYRDELQDCYVADQLSQKLNISVKEIRETCGLIDAYRAKLKLIRKLKQIKSEK